MTILQLCADEIFVIIGGLLNEDEIPFLSLHGNHQQWRERRTGLTFGLSCLKKKAKSAAGENAKVGQFGRFVSFRTAERPRAPFSRQNNFKPNYASSSAKRENSPILSMPNEEGKNSFLISSLKAKISFPRR